MSENIEDREFIRGGGAPIRRVISPLLEFGKKESSAGITLTVAALVGLLLANSQWQDTYTQVLETPIQLGIGTQVLELSLHHWINEFFMALFFLLAGLELKREVLIGSLSTWRKALLPTVAALFGMAVPVSIFLLFNYGEATVSGWAIPMATDIAFALGLLLLLGDRVSDRTIIFLVALAVVDDLAAVLVIAFFYSGDIQLQALGWAGGLLALGFVLNKAGVRHTWPYILLGSGLWLAVLQSGIHATVAGVLLALVIPGWARQGVQEFQDEAADKLEQLSNETEFLLEGSEANVVHLHNLELECERVQPLLHRMEYGLHPWVYYGILPIFALANSGVRLDQMPDGAFSSPLFLGIVLGLVVGKSFGVWMSCKLCRVMDWAKLPASLRLVDIGGLGFLTGVGFTMALFIAGLAFEDAPESESVAKIAILTASAISALVGLAWLKLSLKATGDEN